MDVIVKYSKEGSITPLKLVWEDGRIFEISKVIDTRRAASVKAGGTGIRYTCIIESREKYLFLDTNRWFVEGL